MFNESYSARTVLVRAQNVPKGNFPLLLCECCTRTWLRTAGACWMIYYYVPSINGWWEEANNETRSGRQGKRKFVAWLLNYLRLDGMVSERVGPRGGGALNAMENCSRSRAWH